MVIKETKKSRVTFIPECTCNKKLNYIKRHSDRWDENLDELNQWAEDHEELHKLSREIVDFIADTGKMMKEDILEGFPDHKEDMLSIAANLSVYPIIFPKRRHAPLAEFEQMKQLAHKLTDEYRRIKYASIDDKATEELLLE